MKMKLFYGVAAVVLVALLAAAGCSNPLDGGSSTNDRQATAAAPVSQSVASLAGDPVEIVLLTGQDQVAGIVNVTNDSENLYVEFLPSDEWCIVETHVHVANTLDGFPLVGRWQTPAPGLFDFKTDHDCVAPYEYTIALGDLDVYEDFIIAAHAKLSDGEVTETAWAAGTRFADQGNWATYFTYSWTFMLDLDVAPEGTGFVEGQGRYPAGAEVSLSATPIDHWQFVNWTEGDEEIGSDAVQSYTMPPRDHTLTANFEPILYELTLLVEPPDAGEVSGAGSYIFEEEIELTATANDGYVFAKWTNEDGDQVSVEPDVLFTMPGMDTTLTAVIETAVPQDLESPLIGTLRYVPGGTYQRDSNPDNTTTVSSFHMSVYQITQAQYVAVTGKPNPSYFSSGADAPNRPVEQVSWYDALVFCNMLSMAEGKAPVYSISGSTKPADWGAVPTSSNSTWNAATMNMDANGYRLPTEAEWMWAAMGATSGDGYSGSGVYTTGYQKAFAGSTGSNSIGYYAWYRDSHDVGPGHPNYGTKPVGTKLPNELGLYDMSGNVWEQTWDWITGYPSGSMTDPTGPISGTYRMIRGGSWRYPALYHTVAYRFSDPASPHLRYYGRGFRVVSR